jgi:hypothetical protein
LFSHIKILKTFKIFYFKSEKKNGFKTISITQLSLRFVSEKVIGRKIDDVDQDHGEFDQSGAEQVD